jgi:hypothetical protein
MAGQLKTRTGNFYKILQYKEGGDAGGVGRDDELGKAGKAEPRQVGGLSKRGLQLRRRATCRF